MQSKFDEKSRRACPAFRSGSPLCGALSTANSTHIPRTVLELGHRRRMKRSGRELRKRCILRDPAIPQYWSCRSIAQYCTSRSRLQYAVGLPYAVRPPYALGLPCARTSRNIAYTRTNLPPSVAQELQDSTLHDRRSRGRSECLHRQYGLCGAEQENGARDKHICESSDIVI